MGQGERFLDALKRRKAGESGVESVKDHWLRQRDYWLSDLNALCENVDDWLGDAIQAGVVTKTETKYEVTEPDLGTYMAPGCRVDILVDPPVAVELRPRGCRIVGLIETGGHRVLGANGRVDLERGADRRILLRFKRENAPSAWYSYAAGEKRELDADAFLELLADVAGIDLNEP